MITVRPYLLAAVLLILSSNTLGARKSDPNRCPQAFPKFEVLNQGYPDRDRATQVEDYFAAVTPYFTNTSFSVGGEYFTVPGEESEVIIKKTTDKSIVRRFRVPANYAVKILSSNGKTALLLNLAMKRRNAATVLKVINTETEKELLQLAKPPRDVHGVSFGFLADDQIFVQTHEAISFYRLNETGAKRIFAKEFTAAENADYFLTPIPGSPYAFKHDGWAFPTIVKLSDLRSYVLTDPNITRVGNIPVLKRKTYDDFAQKARLNGSGETPSFKEMKEIIAKLAELRILDVYISKSGRYGVLIGSQGTGNPGGESGNFESVLVLLNLENFKAVHTFYLPDQVVDQAAISVDDRYLARASADGFQVFDIQNPLLPIATNYDRKWFQAYISQLEWRGRDELILRDGMGQILRVKLQISNEPLADQR